MSAWERYHGTFNFDATPMGPIGCPVIIHNKSGKRKSWDFRGRKGFRIFPSLNHYKYFHLVYEVTKEILFSDTVNFLHDYLTQPTVSADGRIIHALNFISCAVKYAPTTSHH